jgi:mono/diheme cytochrome c family protein
VTASLSSLPRLAFTATVALFLLACAPAQFAQAESPKAAEAAGATLFRDKGCAYCHGANLQGTPKGPSLENVRKTLKPERIADQIKNGGQKMPSFEDSLSGDEIAQLVAYLRAKHRPAPAPIPASPALP